MNRPVHEPTEAPRLEPRVHTAFHGVPYYDAELQVAQSPAHRSMVFELGTVLEVVAREVGLTFLSDEPIWYIHPESDEQRAYYGDCVIAAAPSARVTADDLRVVVEVVTTSDRRKEIKDTGFQLVLNEYNAVPEFGLAFPEVDDARALTWHRLSDGRYERVDVAPGGTVEVVGVPGLALRVRPRAEWAPGRKLEVLFRGEPRLPLAGERARAQQERARADALAARLRELGVDPESVTR